MSHNVIRHFDRPLRIAVELAGPEGPHYWADLTTGRADEPALDLSASPSNVVRIRAADLRESAKLRERARSEARADGRDPDGISVLVDLEVLVAEEARSARKQYALLDSRRRADTLSYIGTPHGLAGLIADIHTTRVADGVTLLPLGAEFTIEHIVDGTLPWLESRGLATPSPAVVEVLRRFGTGDRRLIRAS
ncbi:hypothetical protein QT969_08450 [Rhodococcus sp. CSLK01-03]|uniref:Luciferase-like monooxygenase n=1 Tax=Rhodococcus indonesiensis TaxID=3055869 RepID=A0ABT7RL01_9NOCA|nr:hypothetical protein [Rhodococcus indonesiensis]MDM7488313.1 hypothetical protein [Rhodococcus indonesiensis]